VNVAQIGFFVDQARRPPELLLDAWHSLVDIAASVVAAGASVTVVQASSLEGRLSRGGAEFHFLSPGAGGAPLSSSARFAHLVREIRADVFHVHGLGFAREVAALAAIAPATPILLQDHADRPPRFWRRRAWRRGTASVRGVSFCARVQAEPFVRARLFAPHTEIFEIPESTSNFLPGDQSEARTATGIKGAPALLWVGHLDANKDPMTVLEGLALATRELPGIQLWCCYGSAPLSREVLAKISGDARLRNRVHLLGSVPHARVQALMRAADIFVSGSHREGSSFALIEALATGLPPVVTDIPSLRALTGAGQVGALWRCGDAESFATALRSVAAQSTTDLRTRTRAHFEAELSTRALGERFVGAYRKIAAVA
jgi:glycosyltransferase involved in cell wall biosynthesis